MFYFDRMYGELHFPPLIRETLDCPGLLRLREVRMANIPFLSFPSFTGVTRYEHSLGVCHLAGLFADAVGLSEKDKTELMLAGLYHDAATPPFGHAVEEVLSSLHGYDHEEKLRQIITGKSEDLGGQRAQLFLGRSLKLHRVCQSRQARKLGIDVLRIADLAAGTQNDILGDVICSSGIDLDNIDNVIRASTAMGIREYGPSVAEDLARSFIIDGGRVCIEEGAVSYLEAWMKARSALYGMIYSSVEDFSLQTMLKHALRRLARAPTKERLNETDWSLTDEELIYQRLLTNDATREIVTRMRLGAVYTCLAFCMIAQKETQGVRKPMMQEIEEHAARIYREYIERRLKPKRKDFELPEFIANVYPEKRSRSPGRPISFMGKQRQMDLHVVAPRWILGVFTPYHRRWDEEAERDFIARLTASYTVKTLRRIRAGEAKYPNIEEI
jgi:HD superfamily phosphohydrolase